MFNELFQIFRDFEQYERINSNHWVYNVIGQNGKPAPTALENYKRYKEEASAALNKRQRFEDYLNYRRDLLDALSQSIIEGSEEEITDGAAKSIDEAVRKMADKAVKFYFK